MTGAFMKDCQCEWGKCVNGGQVAAGSRGGPKCDAKFTICGQSSKFSRFIVTLAANSHASSSLWPQNYHASSSLWPQNSHDHRHTLAANNNPMQRICEEKARRILHWAFMKDCQCEWGKCVTGRPGCCVVPEGPEM